MPEILTEIIKVAGQLGIFAIAAYWIQKLIDRANTRRLEEYKKTLSILQSKETSLHSKRLEIIESLYKKLVDLDFAARAATSPMKFSPGDFEKFENELVNKASETFKSFHLFYEQNKIYFSAQTCQVINKIRDGFYTALWDYNQHKIVKAHSIEDREVIQDAYQKVISSYKSVKDEIPLLRNELENEFRKILIVE